MSFETEGYLGGYLSPEQMKEQETNGFYKPKKDEWNRSQTDDILKAILGPFARTWKDKQTGRISLGVQKGDRKFVLGSGDSYRSCFEKVFINTVGAMEKLDAEFGPDWRKTDMKKLAEQLQGK